MANLENAWSQAQGRLAEHSSGSEVRAARAEQDRWRWQSEAEELRTLLASRDREIGKMQSKQEVCKCMMFTITTSLKIALLGTDDGGVSDHLMSESDPGLRRKPIYGTDLCFALVLPLFCKHCRLASVSGTEYARPLSRCDLYSAASPCPICFFVISLHLH